MTTEERFTKIENFLSALAEHQARHAEELRELRESQKGMAIAITKIAEAQRATFETQRATFEAQRAIVEAQRITEDKLHALIDTVDRIIRSQSGQN